MQIVSKVIADLSVITSKLGNLAVTTAKIAANAVTGAKILLANAEFLRGRNAANSADVNILQVDASDEIQAVGLWHFNDAAPQSSQAPAVGDALTNKTYVDGVVAGSVVWGFEDVTLSPTDITNQYVDLAQEVTPEGLTVTFSGVVQEEGVDYTLSTVATKTRVTFAGDLATGGAAELVSGDKLGFRYTY